MSPRADGRCSGGVAATASARGVSKAKKKKQRRRRRLRLALPPSPPASLSPQPSSPSSSPESSVLSSAPPSPLPPFSPSSASLDSPSLSPALPELPCGLDYDFTAMSGAPVEDPLTGLGLATGPLGPEPMDAEEFASFAGAAARFLSSYLQGVRGRRVRPSVQPGYLRQMLPAHAPEDPEPWQQVLHDVEATIMPGMTHWQSPHFHGYYPTGSSFAAVLGEMLSAGLGVMGFSWEACPAATELEALVLDWLAQLMGLPEDFLNAAPGPGGGVLQGSASEATLVALLAAKERTVRRLLRDSPELDANVLKTKLISYTCDQANSSVEKAGLLASVPMRLLPADSQGRLRASELQKAIDEDMGKGLIPCFVVATVGSTPTCASDPLVELGELCRNLNLWLHIDAAYAGTALICPEYRHLVDGIHLVDSFCVNPHKWMLVNFDCSAMWVKNSRDLVEAFSVGRVYLTDQKQGTVPDYRHWQIPLGRRFRALKLWLVLRLHGAEGLRAHVRRQVALARMFEQLARADDRFEVVTSSLGLVCFRVKGEESLTAALLDALAASGRIYVVPGAAEGRLCVRFCVCSRFTQPGDVRFAWAEIEARAAEVLAAASSAPSLADTQVTASVTCVKGQTLQAGNLRAENGMCVAHQAA